MSGAKRKGPYQPLEGPSPKKKVLKQYHLRTIGVMDTFIEGYSKKQVVQDALDRPEQWRLKILDGSKVRVVACQKKA